MLDNEVVDIVVPQPAELKLERGLKTVIGELARRYLPREVWDRPKRGFTVPIEQYLTQAWRPYCDDLVQRCDKIAPMLDAAEIRRRWAKHLRGQRVDWPVYSVMVLLGWLDTHRVEWR
jgi:asparagine synthase (glutamine-hydrolysing)